MFTGYETSYVDYKNKKSIVRQHVTIGSAKECAANLIRATELGYDEFYYPNPFMLKVVLGLEYIKPRFIGYLTKMGLME